MRLPFRLQLLLPHSRFYVPSLPPLSPSLPPSLLFYIFTSLAVGGGSHTHTHIASSMAGVARRERKRKGGPTVVLYYYDSEDTVGRCRHHDLLHDASRLARTFPRVSTVLRYRSN